MYLWFYNERSNIKKWLKDEGKILENNSRFYHIVKVLEASLLDTFLPRSDKYRNSVVKFYVVDEKTFPNLNIIFTSFLKLTIFYILLNYCLTYNKYLSIKFCEESDVYNCDLIFNIVTTTVVLLFGCLGTALILSYQNSSITSSNKTKTLYEEVISKEQEERKKWTRDIGKLHEYVTQDSCDEPCDCWSQLQQISDTHKNHAQYNNYNIIKRRALKDNKKNPDNSATGL